MARREPALARAAGIDQLRKVGAVMDTKMVVVRPLGEQNGRHDQPTQRQLPEGLDGGAQQEIYSECMGRVASWSHRCSCKLINVGCVVPARDLDVVEYRMVIIHRAACAETVFFDILQENFEAKREPAHHRRRLSQISGAQAFFRACANRQGVSSQGRCSRRGGGQAARQGAGDPSGRGARLIFGA